MSVLDGADLEDDAPEYTPESGKVWVDAHILASPAATDLNNDGSPELIIPVSYYYDEQEFIDNPHKVTLHSALRFLFQTNARITLLRFDLFHNTWLAESYYLKLQRSNSVNAENNNVVSACGG